MSQPSDSLRAIIRHYPVDRRYYDVVSENVLPTRFFVVLHRMNQRCSFEEPQSNRLLVPAEMSDVTFKRLQTQSSMHVTGPVQLSLFYVPVTRAVSVHLTTLLFFSVPRRLSRDPDMQQPERHTGGIRPFIPWRSRKSDPGVLLDLISSPQHH